MALRCDDGENRELGKRKALQSTGSCERSFTCSHIPELFNTQPMSTQSISSFHDSRAQHSAARYLPITHTPNSAPLPTQSTQKSSKTIK